MDDEIPGLIRAWRLAQERLAWLQPENERSVWGKGAAAALSSMCRVIEAEIERRRELEKRINSSGT